MTASPYEQLIAYWADIRLLGSWAPIEKVGSGPAYWFSKQVVHARRAVEINESNDVVVGGNVVTGNIRGSSWSMASATVIRETPNGPCSR